MLARTLLIESSASLRELFVLSFHMGLSSLLSLWQICMTNHTLVCISLSLGYSQVSKVSSWLRTLSPTWRPGC